MIVLWIFGAIACCFLTVYTLRHKVIPVAFILFFVMFLCIIAIVSSFQLDNYWISPLIVGMYIFSYFLHKILP